MPNLDPWINQKEEHMVATKTITNKFENHLLSIKDEHQERIRPNLHPTYNERHKEHMMTTKTINKFENHLLSIKDEHQERI